MDSINEAYAQQAAAEEQAAQERLEAEATLQAASAVQQEQPEQQQEAQPQQENWMDNLTGTVVAGAMDAFDNLAQGDQSSFDKIEQGLREGSQKRQEERQQNPLAVALTKRAALEGGAVAGIEGLGRPPC